MSSINNKISLRQALLLFLMFLGSPTITLVPRLTNESAKQAAWLTPIISMIFFGLFLFVLQGFYKKHKEKSLIDIFETIIGKVLTKIVCIIYFLWITLTCSITLRYFAERLVSTIFPNSNILVYIIIISILISYVLRGGIEVVARMNEIFLGLILIIYLTTNVLIMPQLKIENYFPITYKDIMPVLGGGIIITSLWGFIIVVFMFSDKITNMENIKKMGLKVMLFLGFLTLMSILIPLGLFGTSFLSNISLPYFMSVREISIMDFIERIEASVVSLWILTDFVFLTVLVYSALYVFKKVFSLSKIKPYINIYMVITILLSLLMSKQIFELWDFSKHISVPLNLFMGYCIPIIIFIVGKIRRKI